MTRTANSADVKATVCKDVAYTFLGSSPPFAHEAEKGGLHTVGQNDDKQCYVSVDIGDNTILATGSIEFCGLDRHEQIVDNRAMILLNP